MSIRIPVGFKFYTLVAILIAAGSMAAVTAFGNDATPSASPSTTAHHALEMTFVGDVMFGRFKESGLDRNPESDVSAFESIEPLIAADIVTANLETPLLKDPPARCPWPQVNIRFAAGSWAADALQNAGFTVVSLANNHAYDMKATGLRDTREMLREREITPVGVMGEGIEAIKVVTHTVNGWRVGFLAFTGLRNNLMLPGGPTMPYIPEYHRVAKVLQPAIEAARASHDIIVVFAHWGKAEEDIPSLGRAAAARRLINIGADVVIGHHTHSLQGIERYKHGLIAHSLGDFLFDKVRTPSRFTGVLRVRYEPGARQPEEVRFHPVLISRRLTSIRPHPATGMAAANIFARLRRLSALFHTRWRHDENDTFTMQPDMQ